MTCKGCGLDKPESEFYRTWNHKPTGKCKICIKMDVKARRDADPIKKAAQDRHWYENNREYSNQRATAWRRRKMATDAEFAERSRTWHREHARKRIRDPIIAMMRQVQGKVRWAVASGRLVRPDKCEQCGVKCKPQGHHTDYSKPLEVTWLCKACHAKTWKLEVRQGGDRATGLRDQSDS